MTVSRRHNAHNPESVTPVTWLIEKDAAEHLAVDPRTIRRWVATGKIPAYRAPSGRLRFKLADLNAALTPVPNGAGGAA